MNLQIYTPNEMPPGYKSQILSLLHAQWPEGFAGKNETRDWISREEFHPVHAVLTDGDTVLAHAGIVWKDLEHAGKQYKTYGLSGVFTHPFHRKKGYGQQVINEAKRYIESQDGDIVLFGSCIIGLYERLGFLRLEKAKLLKGDPINPTVDPETVFMLFLSDKGKAAKQDFETAPIYFGEEMW